MWVGIWNTLTRTVNCNVSVIRPSLQKTKMALIVRPPRDSNFKYSKLKIVPNMRSDSTLPSWTRMLKSRPEYSRTVVECFRAVQNSDAECSGRLELPLKFNFHVIIISWAYSRVSFHLGTRVVTEDLHDHSLSRWDNIWCTLTLDTRVWS